MSEHTREFYGSTLDEALTKAAAFLNVDRDSLEYEVIDEGSSGFLGIGTRDARILIQNTQDAKNWVNTSDVVTQTFSEDDLDTHVENEAKGTGAPGDSEPSPTLDLSETPAESESEEEGGSEPLAVEAASEELLSEIHDFTEELLSTAGFECRVDVYDAGDFVAVDVATPEAGLFIGQKGETIDAFQHLLNVVAYKNRPYGKRLVLDSEGYRQRRIEALQGMAHRSARKASREQRTVELPPMNSSERRVVHVYLKDSGEVTTASEGNGPSRRVTISPIS